MREDNLTADQTKEKQIGTSKETYEPVYGKSIQLFLPNESIEELKHTLNELSEVEK